MTFLYPFQSNVSMSFGHLLLGFLDFESCLCILPISSIPDVWFANTVNAHYLWDLYLGICLHTEIVALKSMLAVLFQSFADMHSVAKILSLLKNTHFHQRLNKVMLCLLVFNTPLVNKCLLYRLVPWLVHFCAVICLRGNMCDK